MNVLRSLARQFLSITGVESSKQSGEPGLRGALDKKIVPPVVDLGRYRDSFEQLPSPRAMHTLKGERAFTKSAWASLATEAPTLSAATYRGASPALGHLKDGFESGRRPPIDLSGGVKPAVTPLVPERPAPQPAGSNGFTASLDDLL